MIKKLFQQRWLIGLIFVLTVLATKPYLTTGFPYTHDGENHLARFANYKIAVREGQIPPRWAPNLMNHYGYPVLNYVYPLANLLSLPFSLMKFYYGLTFKILASLSIAFGLVGLWQWLTEWQLKNSAKVFSLLAYVVSPYLVNLVYFRGNIGELMALNLLIWLFYWAERLVQNKQLNFTDQLFGLLTWTGFLLAHNIAVLFGTPLVIAYLLLRLQLTAQLNINKIKQFGCWLVGAILLTLWFWLPALAEKEQIILDQAQSFLSYQDHFVSLPQLLFSPLSFGFSYIGRVDSLSFSLGVVLVVSLGLTGLYLVKQLFLGKLNTFILLNWLACLLLIALQLSFTRPIWQLLPVLAYIQFPWRLTLFATVLSLPLIAMIFQQTQQLGRFMLVGFLLVQLIGLLKLQPVDYFQRTNLDYDAFAQSTATLNEYTPKGFSYIDFSDWQPTAKLLTGEGKIDTQFWSGSQRKYQLNLATEAVIVEPTMNFLGWQTQANGQRVNYLNNDQVQGRLAYQLPAGEYQVITRFTQQTWPRLLGNLVSGFTVGVLVYWLVKKFIRK
ncbi:MAG: hypothetical protein GF390_00295 [Candidatus Pacebacteria bacterium]|nr:hypothetical protein [Candidatus Paceibacterota bacterium]